MIHLHFLPTDLSRVRFAVSPLWETVASIRTLQNARGAGHLHRAWAEQARTRVRAELDDRTIHLLSALVRPAGYLPDFLVPPPSTRSTTWAVALDQVAAADPQVAAQELRHLADHPVAQHGAGRADRGDVLRRLAERPDGGIGPVVDALAAYHRVAVAPVWRRVDALLRADISRRLEAFADGGVQQMMRDLHPSVSFASDTLDVVKYYEGHADLGGRGLLLVPCAFAWPDVVVRTAAPGPATVAYAPRGVGRLWEAQPTAQLTSLAEVIGRTRAHLLAQLDLPMTTSQAASQLDLSAATVNEHLQALRAAGLLESIRDGRRVLYARTQLGERLLQGGGAD